MRLRTMDDLLDLPLGVLVLAGVCLAAVLIVIVTSNWNKRK